MGDFSEMNNLKMMDAYMNSEREAVVEANDPHTLIAVMFDELLKSMHIFHKNLEKSTSNQDIRSKHLSRSISIIYALQKSLDFERGGEIAENLFRLYEHARLHLLDASKSENAKNLELSIKSLEEVCEAWRVIRA